VRTWVLLWAKGPASRGTWAPWLHGLRRSPGHACPPARCSFSLRGAVQHQYSCVRGAAVSPRHTKMGETGIACRWPFLTGPWYVMQASCSPWCREGQHTQHASFPCCCCCLILVYWGAPCPARDSTVLQVPDKCLCPSTEYVYPRGARHIRCNGNDGTVGAAAAVDVGDVR